ncbi:MAG: sugar phosphate isomerase/epimerase [Gemmatimonadetes bacterium]|nr:sugar phosphate isomerase/epimerase [Gemmatimonadota bacterium]
MTPISVQLYSLREASEQNFDAVLEELSAIGYAGVEPFNLFGKTPHEFRAQVESLGMKVSSSHTPWANRSPIDEVVEALGELGLKRAIGGFMPDDFRDLDAVRRTADTCQGLIDQLEPQGIELAIHNHWWEFELMEGRPAMHHLAEMVPALHYELDTYWAANFGACDPAEELARIATKAPLLHIKDGPLEQKQPMVAVGQGKVDVRAVIAATDPGTVEWLVVELDACATDMMTAIRESYEYLTGNELAEGRK